MILSIIIASVIFAGILFLIFTEKVNRVIAAVSGAALMIISGHLLGFYEEHQALEAIDFETVGLLLGMMTLVAILEPTGFFEFLAVWAARLSGGKPVRLLILLGSVTTLLSMFLDNVTTVVLIAPVTILISEILGINPTPLLMAEALLSDTGGAATLVGDPPNVLIASAAGFTFTDFLVYALPIVAVAWLTALIILRIFFRRDLANSKPNTEAILKLKPEQALNDRKTAIRVLVVLGAAILLFFFQSMLGFSPAVIALVAGAAAMAWIRPDPREMLKRVEWGVLVFFVALFVMVGGLEHAGVLDIIANQILNFGDSHPLLLGLGMLWAVAALSAIVDNVPITIALIPVIQGLGEAGINITPLWWALVFGAGFGGNGTIIGSTANIVVASLSERTRAPITSKLWNKRGLPVMLATCLVASILYSLFYGFLSR